MLGRLISPVWLAVLLPVLAVPQFGWSALWMVPLGLAAYWLGRLAAEPVRALPNSILLWMEEKPETQGARLRRQAKEAMELNGKLEAATSSVPSTQGKGPLRL